MWSNRYIITLIKEGDTGEGYPIQKPLRCETPKTERHSEQK